MPDILLDYDRFKKEMICDHETCEYEENGYKFIYKDGIADLLPIQTHKKKAPPYYPRSSRESDLPPTRQPEKLKWAIITTILLIFMVFGFFFVYEVYYMLSTAK